LIKRKRAPHIPWTEVEKEMVMQAILDHGRDRKLIEKAMKGSRNIKQIGYYLNKLIIKL
jgi:hypothetical protein